MCRLKTTINKNAKSLPTMTEKVLILEPERVIQTTVVRKMKVVDIEVNGKVSPFYYSQGKRWNKCRICYRQG